MHPPLFSDHPLCHPEVRALVACHNDFPAGKFFGKCNAAKAELDHCFRMEKRMRRATNADRRRVSASAMLKDIEAREAGLGGKP
ncbi:hypothetical protein FNF27_04538 [Cafeteria roenbergensis]|uniref:COX assembly mitochondrial protein n=1 Tax=Cafeteria roenbergensis TaxID=33653 RepID=A0A5A8DCL4_CAFRO|nr:hypothetical protein FNF29_06188 [Cafeteria roenbergensis]KAA0158709.1 hypothetical protein FNF31_05235 [Cafeteria roenbergensis]KAA0163035.1 hypothetical protein FNF28_04425 [Cafeteria roenbergensis]KAA0173977.1 hypothetical protein FNF27_04538 [Cafeteria roenbergensis]|eukprot:KAA0149100.1 hypothetical protein FNF29_06188 [Cafeteria roenbergensis]